MCSRIQILLHSRISRGRRCYSEVRNRRINEEVIATIIADLLLLLSSIEIIKVDVEFDIIETIW